MNVYILMAAALVWVATVAGAGWKGYGLGGDAEKAANAAEREAAREKAEATRKADQDAARRTAQTLQSALAKQKRLATDLGDSLAKHISAMPKRPDCVVSDGVLQDLNASLAGTSNPGRSVSGGGQPAKTADGGDDGSPRAETR